MGNQKDITQKHLLCENDVFADVINNALFDGKQIVEEGELVDSVVSSQFRAILYYCRLLVAEGQQEGG